MSRKFMMKKIKLYLFTALAGMLTYIIYLSLYSPEQSLDESPIRYDDSLNRNPWWDGGYACRSLEELQRPPTYISKDDAISGHCGRRSWEAGPGQKIISFSLYGNNKKYLIGLEANLNASKHLYPNYFVRLYTDPVPYKKLLCPLLRKYEHFHICDVKSLPTLGNIHKVQPIMWRLAPLGDPQVDILLVRDPDSQISSREVDAVHDWLSTGHTLHVMRDHPQHMAPIIDCCWGMRQDITREHKENTGAIRKTLFDLLLNKYKHMEGQNILNEILWTDYEHDVVRHESYRCREYQHSRPWPTEREDEKHFVGSQRSGFQKKHLEECPVYCRPEAHQDWRYC
ncbi:unnamed protein product [Meganyctiphanes norvegica]|uniref:Uncharacterized protein n=1 Tax=Meganyctiphanes norvegica TaxID=48144 RepID=A0AAV2R563_MEGNR